MSVFIVTKISKTLITLNLFCYFLHLRIDFKFSITFVVGMYSI